MAVLILVVVHLDRPAALLTNTTEAAGRFVELKLRGTRDNRNAIGARVTVTCGDRVWRSDVTSGDGYFCSNERSLVFGIGAADRVNRVEIRWPNGMIEHHADLPADSRWIVVQGRQPVSLSY